MMKTKKLAFPMVLVSVVGVVMWAHSENGARPKATGPIQQQVVSKPPSEGLPDKHFVFGKFHVIALSAANNNTLLRDVMIYSHSPAGSKSKVVIQCEVARQNPQNPDKWVLKNGFLRLYDYNKQPTKKWGTATSSSSFKSMETYLR